jgi:hypothetical protein
MPVKTAPSAERRAPSGVCFLALLALTACPPTQKDREICGNGFDDDNNGLADCADPDCAGQSGCPAADAGYFGSCNKCGQTCTGQTACLQYGYSSDQPLPDCAGGKCQSFNTAIQVRVEVDTQSGGWNFVSPTKSILTRFIRKTALDGSPVTCSSLQAVAASNCAADVNQIERSGQFNLIGWDSTGINGSLGTLLPLPFVHVATAQDFLIWIEIWSGVRDATGDHFPTGVRKGWGCFETGPAVAALVPADDCPTNTTSPTCRTVHVEMPGPPATATCP